MGTCSVGSTIFDSLDFIQYIYYTHLIISRIKHFVEAHDPHAWIPGLAAMRLAPTKHKLNGEPPDYGDRSKHTFKEDDKIDNLAKGEGDGGIRCILKCKSSSVVLARKSQEFSCHSSLQYILFHHICKWGSSCFHHNHLCKWIDFTMSTCLVVIIILDGNL